MATVKRLLMGLHIYIKLTKASTLLFFVAANRGVEAVARNCITDRQQGQVCDDM